MDRIALNFVLAVSLDSVGYTYEQGDTIEDVNKALGELLDPEEVAFPDFGPAFQEDLTGPPEMAGAGRLEHWLAKLVLKATGKGRLASAIGKIENLGAIKTRDVIVAMLMIAGPPGDAAAYRQQHPEIEPAARAIGALTEALRETACGFVDDLVRPKVVTALLIALAMMFIPGVGFFVLVRALAPKAAPPA